MKEYLKMSDVFNGLVSSHDGELLDDFGFVADFYKPEKSDHAAHAINSHDGLVRKLDVAELTIYEAERVLSEMQRNGIFGLDDLVAEVEKCIKRLSE